MLCASVGAGCARPAVSHKYPLILTNWKLSNTSLMFYYFGSPFNDFSAMFYKLSTTDS